MWRDASPPEGSPDVAVSRVLFEPGARTHWHTHPEGQILHVITGTGRARREAGETVEIGPGDVVYFAPGEKHWHGASPDNPMVHLATNPATTSDGGTEWLEPVTDEEYGGGASQETQFSLADRTGTRRGPRHLQGRRYPAS